MCSSRKQKENFYPKIDIVYTWVEADDDFLDDRNRWLRELNLDEHDGAGEFKRYEDSHELKYSLRSIEQFFPDYNKIYLVVRDGQFPKYLRRDHPRLQVINHSDIIPSEYLPTFNSMAIEAYIHRIPDLSEYYLYCNDDVMFLKKTTPDYFINKETLIPYSLHDNLRSRSYLTEPINFNDYDFSNGWQLNYLILDQLHRKEENGRYFMAHIPKMYKRSFDFEIENRLRKYYLIPNLNSYDATGQSKFRKNSNLFLVALLKENLYVYWFNGEWKETKHSTLYYMENAIEKISTKSRFLCVQQINNKTRIPEYQNLMTKLYPKPSTFEI